MASPDQNAPRAEDILKLASDIVSAYVSNNPVPAADLPNMIRSVHATLGGLSSDGLGEGIPGGHKPAVPVKKSITPDYVICLEDGKKLKMLKRYLRSRYDLSPEEYRSEMGPARRLSDGRAELRGQAFRIRQEDRLGPLSRCAREAPRG